MKYINFKRYKFSTITKYLNTLKFNFLKNFKIPSFVTYYFKKTYKYIDIRTFDFKKVIRRFNPATYIINQIKNIKFKSPKFLVLHLPVWIISFKKVIRRFNLGTYIVNQVKNIKFKSSKFLVLHLPVWIISFGLLYLIIPTFYNYDKSEIEKEICQKQNIECLIKGEVNYRFYPTPRIIIKNLIINNVSKKKKNTIITAENVVAKISIRNLLVKEKQVIKKIQLDNFEINFNFKNFDSFRNVFSRKNDLIPISFIKGQIMFYDGADYVAAFSDVLLNLKITQDSAETLLKGKFLTDDIYINLNSKKIDDKVSTDLIFKMSKLNILTKANIINLINNKNSLKGNVLIKQDKNRITAIFDYKDNEINIYKSNLKNTFLDGKLEGKITLSPYFNFNLDIDLNSVNFTRLYNNFLSLDENKQKNFFKTSNKINGKLNLTSEKIYSSYNLIKSLESRIQLNNGNIIIDQLLLNFGKLGAADVLGTIGKDKKFSSFKFESNIFVDNQKKFLNKFGIYNKKNIPSNLFIAGNFDLNNLKCSFYEISDDKQLSNDELNFIESEFNNLMLENGYESLFYFPNFKKFIKSITIED